MDWMDSLVYPMTGTRNARIHSRKTMSFLCLRGLLILTLLIGSSTGFAQAQELPAQVYISGFAGHPQRYSLSCESRSGADLANFWGSPVTEDEVLNGLGLSDNPEFGFVGNVHGVWGAIPPHGYGVHAAPIARVLREYGLPAESYRGMSWDDARAHLAAGRPVIVWIIGAMWSGTPVAYTASDGQTVTVAHYEHTMTLVGYSPGLVHVVDSYTGQPQTYGLESFLTSWAVLENQAVVVHGQPAAPQPQSVEPAPAPEDMLTVQPGDTLASLALANGLTWPELAARNGLSYPYTIYAGQALRVSGNSSPNTESGSPASPAEVSEPILEEDRPVISDPDNLSAREHLVKAGDTLLGVARQYGTTWEAVADLNGLDFPYFIYPDQILRLPAGETAQPRIPESESEPAQPSPPEETNSPAATETYQVQPGEYLIDLARRFGMDWKALADLNGITFPYTIYPGQTLILE